MVWKVEIACQTAGVEFLGWDLNTQSATIRVTKDGMPAFLKLPRNTLELMSADKWAVLIEQLFVTPNPS